MTARSLCFGFPSLFEEEVVLSSLICFMGRYWVQTLESVYHIQRGMGTLHVSIPKTYPKTRNQVQKRVKNFGNYVW